MKKIIDCTTGEETEVELTAKDAKQQEIDEKAWLAREAEKIELESKKQAVWEKLGLTPDEVSALLA
jgi:hypothetical protein